MIYRFKVSTQPYFSYILFNIVRRVNIYDGGYTSIVYPLYNDYYKGKTLEYISDSLFKLLNEIYVLRKHHIDYINNYYGSYTMHVLSDRRNHGFILHYLINELNNNCVLRKVNINKIDFDNPYYIYIKNSEYIVRQCNIEEVEEVWDKKFINIFYPYRYET
ncbi:MAG: hypothetical protein KatS3mg002_1329 [Candidatus Woesearchaeota archaeon]|nr:MAG: hypothetical protein KatS3mg002_1329 [Candidatus Woesearchaeota archaeon]